MKRIKNDLFLLSFLLSMLTGCTGKTDSRTETIKTKDPQTKLIVQYGANGRVAKITTTNSDSSQSLIVLFDTMGIIYSTGLNKNGKRIHSTEYYANGRPMGLTNFDSTITGDAIYYFDNGLKKSEGRWEHYRMTGIWKNYNDKGEIIKIDTLN